MLRILKVTGNSLLPLIQEGDFVLVIKIPILSHSFLQYRVGDTVVINHPYYGIIIKKIQQISADQKQFYVVGTWVESIDSRQFGFIEYKWLTGKVIWHIKKPG